MYIVAIAWIYVTLLMALTEESLFAGILTFSVYGLAPLSLTLWLFGAPERRRRNRRREAEQERGEAQAQNSTAKEVLDEVVSKTDGRNPRNDQHHLL